MSARIAVLAGRGKTGRAVASALADRGADPVQVGRWAPEALADRLLGCDAAYVVAPNLHPDEPRYAADVVLAARRAGVPRLVLHSVASPYAPGMPHHVGKAQAEDVVRRGGLSWTVLQPCAYVQNLLPGLHEDPPGVVVPYDVDRPFGLVDLADVAEAAARVLLEPDAGHEGATYELAGPRLVSVRDVAREASEVLGREVPCRRVDPAGTAERAPGLDSRQRDWLRRMFEYYDAHGFPAGPRPLADLLGREAHGIGEVLRRELG